MKPLLFLALFCQLTTLPALLSPIHQSIKEIESILQEADLPLLLGQEHEIKEIIRTKEGYLIRTEVLEITADLIYDTQTRIGPRQYKIRFHTPAREIRS